MSSAVQMILARKQLAELAAVIVLVLTGSVISTALRTPCIISPQQQNQSRELLMVELEYMSLCLMSDVMSGTVNHLSGVHSTYLLTVLVYVLNNFHSFT